MAIEHFEKADHPGSADIDQQRSGAFRGTRSTRRQLLSVGLGLAMMVPLAAAIAAPQVGAATATGSAAAAASAKCGPTTAHGLQTITYCGPATATLSVGKKTYSFKNGECVSISVSHIKVDVTLGAIAENSKTYVPAKGNAGLPYFSLDLAAGNNASLLNPIEFGGKELTPGHGVTAKGAVVSKGTSKGTFTAGPGVSGTWNCHGAFAAH